VGKPTCLNNVETWANVPFIVNRGADWFRSMGTANSKGPRSSRWWQGEEQRPCEVPMGLRFATSSSRSRRNARGKKFKGVQTGGPSGGVLPEALLDLPVDFDELDKVAR